MLYEVITHLLEHPDRHVPVHDRTGRGRLRSFIALSRFRSEGPQGDSPVLAGLFPGPAAGGGPAVAAPFAAAHPCDRAVADATLHLGDRGVRHRVFDLRRNNFV